MPDFLVTIEPKLFNKTYLKHLNAIQPIQIFFGGSSSGKSKFLAQRVIKDLMEGGRNFLIVRNTGNTLKTSVFTELTKVIDEWGVGRFFTINKSDLTIQCKNGYIALLKGLDDVEKVKSITVPKGALTDIWIEEATETTRDAYKKLTKRLRGLSDKPKRVTLTFNPILKSHWIYKEFFKTWNDDETRQESDDLLIVKTTYKDNDFLTDQDRKLLEEETDSYFYEVYTLGKWGVLGDRIFTNWSTVDLLDKEYMFDQYEHGLDFGFTNDPTAYVKAYYHRASKTIYIWREYANKGVTNEQIAADIKPMLGDDTVVCDSAEPKSITELNGYGISAIGAKKGKDSVLHGIQWLQKHSIMLDKSCQNCINNFQQYHWLKDREGNVLNKPVDRFNDFIDALRYALEHLMTEFDDDSDLIESDELDSARADW